MIEYTEQELRAQNSRHSLIDVAIATRPSLICCSSALLHWMWVAPCQRLLKGAFRHRLIGGDVVSGNQLLTQSNPKQ